MMRCFCPPERLVPRSDTIVSSFFGSELMNSFNYAAQIDENISNSNIATQVRSSCAGAFPVRSIQYHCDATIRRPGLCHHIAHEADNDDRENQNREVAVECHEIAQTHRAQNDKAP